MMKKRGRKTQEKLTREFDGSKEEIREAREIDQATDIEIEALQWFVEQRLQLGAVPWIVASALYFTHLQFDLKEVQPAPEWAAFLRRTADYLESHGKIFPMPPPPLTKAWMERVDMPVTEH